MRPKALIKQNGPSPSSDQSIPHPHTNALKKAVLLVHPYIDYPPPLDQEDSNTNTNSNTTCRRSNYCFMSASDSAPLVAAILNDRTVAGLIQENNELKSRENERLLVQITGTNGTPVHYEGSFKHAERYSYDDDRDDRDSWYIYLGFDKGSSDNLTTDGFPLSSLAGIKIRLGGVDVQRFNIDGLIIHLYDGLYDEETRTEDIHIHVPNGSGPVEYVHGYIGPLPLGWQQKHVPQHAGDDMLLTDLLERVADENNDLTPQTLIIKGLTFYENAIPGIMSFTKK
ncbi:hypothetical protein FRACYDRAFT_249041 [Fragilariopsis cylindrus CCMP1102]|uniref:Uncharacterized protein n=1 Tax=Fragilariopsis cylindrus CCMP1102 TaxID=635003 RepID=A0A1E7ESY8_9STRA|nr:hypothetical protein FRACYDRAFT_249041 [Fragilariopsis cylindrus CCMP1102]|eukprot:OEU09128.1 hypothetical protein FRACYDRAFT_249041 [Fragilariopsis cylindrus CCMP1102]